MNYNYKFLKYKNKFLNQYGGNIDKSIANLRLNDFRVDEIIVAAGAAFRMFKVTRNDNTIFFVKLMNDYPTSAPIICYKGKNIYKLLENIRKHEVGSGFDDNKWLAALLVRTTLFNNDRKELEDIYGRLIVEKSRLDEILEKDRETKQLIRVASTMLEEKKAKLEILKTNLSKTVLKENKEKINEDISVMESHISQLTQKLSDLHKKTLLSDGEISANQSEIEKLQINITKKFEELKVAPAHKTFADILLTEDFLNKTDDTCYDMLSVEELERLKLEELDKKARLEQQIINSTSYLDIIGINDRLYYIYERLKNIYPNLRFKLKDVDKDKSKEYDKENKKNFKSCEFLLSILAEDQRMNVIKDIIQHILDTISIDAITIDDVTDKRLIELINEFNTKFGSIYEKYNRVQEELVKSKAVIIKRLKDKWISDICKEIITKYGSKNLHVISFIKLNKLIIE